MRQLISVSIKYRTLVNGQDQIFHPNTFASIDHSTHATSQLSFITNALNWLGFFLKGNQLKRTESTTKQTNSIRRYDWLTPIELLDFPCHSISIAKWLNIYRWTMAFLQFFSTSSFFLCVSRTTKINVLIILSSNVHATLLRCSFSFRSKMNDFCNCERG